MHATWLWYHTSSHKNSRWTLIQLLLVLGWPSHQSEPHLNSWEQRAFIHQHQMEQVFLIHWDGLALFVDKSFHQQTNPVHNQMTTEKGLTSKDGSMVYIRAALQSVPHKTACISHHHLANNISGFSWADMTKQYSVIQPVKQEQHCWTVASHGSLHPSSEWSFLSVCIKYDIFSVLFHCILLI